MNTSIAFPQQKMIKGDDGNIYHLVFHDGLVIHLTYQNLSVCYYLPKVYVGKKKLETIITEVKNYFHADESLWVVKIIGGTSPILAAKEFFNNHHVTNVKEKIIDNSAHDLYFYADGSSRLRLSKQEQKTSFATTSHTQPSTPTALNRKLRVLVVDDSKSIQTILRKVLAQDSMLEVVGVADRPSQVENMIVQLKPDVITLDIHMPEMDGVTLLRKLMPKFNLPTVMISSLGLEEGSLVLEALEVGAVDYIQKPSLDELDEVTPVIIEKVKTAAIAKIQKSAPKLATQAATKQTSIAPVADLQQNILIAIGSSTGGPEALRQVLTKLPPNIPPIAIVQHIPAVFSQALAKRLNDLCAFEVREAKDGDELLPGLCLIAPGGTQMTIIVRNNKWFAKIDPNAAPVNRHKPSVDVMFDSVAAQFGKRAIGVILTGMGADGAKGLLKMKMAGARTIGQDESSCVVYGMPREAAKIGATEIVTDIDKISSEILSLLSAKKAAA